jgi:hypothetical protein
VVVPQVALLLEEPQHSAYCGITRRIWKLGANFSCRRPAKPVNDVHYLPLARAEIFHRALPVGYSRNMSIH